MPKGFLGGRTSSTLPNIFLPIFQSVGEENDQKGDSSSVGRVQFVAKALLTSGNSGEGNSTGALQSLHTCPGQESLFNYWINRQKA